MNVFRTLFHRLFFLIVLIFVPVQAGALEVNFLARLANFDGIVPSIWSRIAADEEHLEIFTLNPRDQEVRIYDRNGMEIFEFGDNVELAGASDLDLGEDGNIYLVFPRHTEHQIMRLDYKGEPLASFKLSDFPADFTPFNPEILQYRQDKLYLANGGTMDVAVTDINGTFERGYHLKESLLTLEDELADQPGGEALLDPEQFKFIDMFGFWVDEEGSIFFTVPTLFTAFKYSSNGELSFFGASGSAPGKFGVVSGITTDKRGNIYIADRLRSVVMIFSPDFEFQKEFGYRGFGRGSLIVPDDIVVDDQNGLIFVAQAANRGVSVFRIKDD